MRDPPYVCVIKRDDSAGDWLVQDVAGSIEGRTLRFPTYDATRGELLEDEFLRIARVRIGADGYGDVLPADADA
jgi:hypothetical protein